MNRYSSILIGVLFILFGLLLVVKNLGLWIITWFELYPLLLVVVGILFFINACKGKKNQAFWGTFFLVLGVFFFLRNYGFIQYYWMFEIWPIFILAAGLAFIVLYGFKPDEWGILIPAAILTFWGSVYLLRGMGFYWPSIRYAKQCWPLLLVFIGIGLVISSLTGKKNKTPEK
jgi:hypothetical protein